MKFRQEPEWTLSPSEAIKTQKRLSLKIKCNGIINTASFLAGVDVSVDRLNMARAAIVVLRQSDLKVVEVVSFEDRVNFPYIPGLLSFREIPILLEAFKKLKRVPDLIFVDGQGIAHPRKIGLASHLGLVLNIPTIGCAKSHLYGEYEKPDNEVGAYKNLVDKNGSIIGVVLRTKIGVKPLYISVGHKIDLPSSITWVLQCCKGYRLPEPTRKAHQASRGNLKFYPG